LIYNFFFLLKIFKKKGEKGIAKKKKGFIFAPATEKISFENISGLLSSLIDRIKNDSAYQFLIQSELETILRQVN